MNKKDYKRYKKIRAEIAQLNQDIDDCMTSIKMSYEQRDLKGAKKQNRVLENLLQMLYKRETISDELLLPKYVKLENGYQDVKDFIKDNEWFEDEETSIIEEYVSNYLLDETNHNLYGFNYVVKGNDIYVTKIRWNQYQILESDLKDVLKGNNWIENDYVEVVKDITFKGCLLIKSKESSYIERCTLKEAIRELENKYVM
jgi:hypothetical protein